MMSHRSWFWSLCLVCLLLAGCNRSASTQPGLSPIQAEDPIQTRPAEGSTVDPATSSAGASPQAPAPTPGVDLVDPRIQAVGYIDVGILIVVIESQAPLSGEYWARVGEEDYSCSLQEMFPNNLYCSGPEPAGQARVQMEVFSAGTDELKFRGDVEIPE